MNAFSVNRIVSVTAALLMLLSASSSNAFWPDIHEDITYDALKYVQAKLSSGKVINFSPQRIKELGELNAITDKDQTSFKHFDNELLIISDKVLSQNRKILLNNFSGSPEFIQQRLSEALRFLGMSFHALQDFYSHSTWVESRNPKIAGLGNDSIAFSDPHDIGRICLESPGSLLASKRKTITTGYFPSLPDDLDFKCVHGLPFFGLNKDSVLISPFLYGKARDFAKLETISYAQLIVKDLKGDPTSESNPEANDAALCALLDPVNTDACTPPPLKVTGATVNFGDTVAGWSGLPGSASLGSLGDVMTTIEFNVNGAGAGGDCPRGAEGDFHIVEVDADADVYPAPSSVGFPQEILFGYSPRLPCSSFIALGKGDTEGAYWLQGVIRLRQGSTGFILAYHTRYFSGNPNIPASPDNMEYLEIGRVDNRGLYTKLLDISDFEVVLFYEPAP